MAEARDKTILVVDDEPDVREYLRTVLEDAEFNVVTAGDGEEALEVIQRERPDFISLDLIMPKKSGHKLLYELNARDEMGKDSLEDILSSSVMSGPGTYLEKPVNPLSYVRSIQRALGLEESKEAEDKLSLRDELQQELQGAGADALRDALQALKKGSGG
jgi:DNA-binding NtrC family response regulator